MNRKEALKIVRDLYEKSLFLKKDKEAIETLIPELNESEDKSFIEIPFGAKDSELCGWEYTIPEGMEAEIKDGKVIVKKKESENERIRKALMQNLKERFGTKGSMGEGLDMPDVLIWLERQKEQKPAEWSEEDLKWAEEIRLALRFYSEDKPFVEKLTNWFNNHIQPKPAEWSEGMK